MSDSISHINTGASLAESITLKFADGEHTVPEWIVGHLGGAAKLQENAAQFKGVTYAAFIKAFDTAAARQQLNNFGAQFVRQSLKGR